MEIGNWQKVGFARGQPSFARDPLTLWAVAIPAAIVRDSAMVAVVASLDMAAERRGPAQLDRRHDAPFDATKMAVMGNAVSRAMAAEYIRHLQRRAHSGRLSWAAPRPG